MTETGCDRIAAQSTASAVIPGRTNALSRTRPARGRLVAVVVRSKCPADSRTLPPSLPTAGTVVARRDEGVFLIWRVNENSS